MVPSPALYVLAVATLLSLVSVCYAQMPGKANLEGAEAAARLIGAPVLATDGMEVGKLADVMFNEEGTPTRIRIDAASHLGLGTRRVEIPKGAFTMSIGRVVLELPADTVLTLPEQANSIDEQIENR